MTEKSRDKYIQQPPLPTPRSSLGKFHRTSLLILLKDQDLPKETRLRQ